MSNLNDICYEINYKGTCSNCHFEYYPCDSGDWSKCLACLEDPKWHIKKDKEWGVI